MSDPEADTDRTLGFIVSERHARGRFVRLGPALEAILANHGYPPVIEKLLAEALLLTALLGSLLKGDNSQMTMQAQTENGVVGLLVTDYKAGALRGYVQFDADKLAEAPVEPGLFALFGKGYLAITFDEAGVGPDQRYQGIVPLEGETLSAAVEHYFVQSEQIPSLIVTGISENRRSAGAMLLQHLPEGEQGRERLHVRLDHPEWEHVHILGSTMKTEELCDTGLPLETLVWRLFHDEGEVRVLGGAHLAKGCRCDPARIRNVIARFSAEDRSEMANEQGDITVDCAFCATDFRLKLADFPG